MFFNSRFIKELDWYLIVEHDVFVSESKLTETFIINLFLSLLVTSGVVFIAHITFSKYQNYGHLVGNNVIQRISSICKEESSDISAVCRWGGEEFIIMLPNSNISDVKALASKIQNSIQSIGITPDVTMSFGITQLKPYDELDSLLHRADDMLYQAKRNGRNRIEVSK